MRQLGIVLGLVTAVAAVIVIVATESVWWNVAAIAAALVGSFVTLRAAD
jgi:membrane protein YdbS with pleckstrin-like domain